ncbi:replication protein [Escherichia coli]|nr:replication protein [Escherichia coli]EFO6313251.1 replication protein [Escherichia coli]QNJ73891.1 replication protein [Escherichia coli]
MPLSLHGRSAGSEAIPEPVKQLPVMGGRPLNRVQSLAKIAEIKAKFGLKGASV